MKVRAPSQDSRYFDVTKLIHGASLHTICERQRHAAASKRGAVAY